MPHIVNESEKLGSYGHQGASVLTSKFSPFKYFSPTFFLLWLCRNPQLSQLFMFSTGSKNNVCTFLVKENTSNSSTVIRIFIWREDKSRTPMILTPKPFLPWIPQRDPTRGDSPPTLQVEQSHVAFWERAPEAQWDGAGEAERRQVEVFSFPPTLVTLPKLEEKIAHIILHWRQSGEIPVLLFLV